MTKTPFVPKEPGYYWLMDNEGNKHLITVDNYGVEGGRLYFYFPADDVEWDVDSMLKMGTFAPGPLIPPDDKEFS